MNPILKAESENSLTNKCHHMYIQRKGDIYVHSWSAFMSTRCYGTLGVHQYIDSGPLQCGVNTEYLPAGYF